MIGPILIGPSSSHTAGVVRIGRVGLRILGDIPEKAEVTFYNSFAKTYEGHSSDRAILAGHMDLRTDDSRIKTALELAEKQNIDYKFKSVGNASITHPNTVNLHLFANDHSVTVTVESRGGGLIRILEVNGFESGFSARLHTLIIIADDVKGSIAYISDILTHDDCNIATMTVSRKGKHDMACQIIEMDSGVQPLTLEYMKNLKWVKEVIYIPDIDL